MAKILDGKKLAKLLNAETRHKVSELKKNPGATPICLATLLIGNDGPSEIYVRRKISMCQKLGILSKFIRLPDHISQEELISKIQELNDDTRVHGILLQLPLPPQLNTFACLETILPEKDVDGFNSQNVGRLTLGQASMVPCTPRGIIELLSRHELNLQGRHCVILGRSNVVGRPLASLLAQHHATVTICHSKTIDPQQYCRLADVVISAVGKPKMIGADWIKKGAVVIDVGINRLPNGSLVGDLQFEEVSQRASWITPVPGGVGPLTISMLMKNTVKAYENILKE